MRSLPLNQSSTDEVEDEESGVAMTSCTPDGGTKSASVSVRAKLPTCLPVNASLTL